MSEQQAPTEAAATAGRAGSLTKLGFNSAKWQSRYFELQENIMFYYASQGGSRKGAIGLVKDASCELVATDATFDENALSNISKAPKAVPEFAFKVVVPWKNRTRSFYMYAENAEDAKAWVDAIVAAIKVAPEVADIPQQSAASRLQGGLKNAAAAKEKLDSVPKKVPSAREAAGAAVGAVEDGKADDLLSKAGVSSDNVDKLKSGISAAKEIPTSTDDVKNLAQKGVDAVANGDADGALAKAGVSEEHVNKLKSGIETSQGIADGVSSVKDIATSDSLSDAAGNVVSTVADGGADDVLAKSGVSEESTEKIKQAAGVAADVKGDN